MSSAVATFHWSAKLLKARAVAPTPDRDLSQQVSARFTARPAQRSSFSLGIRARSLAPSRAPHGARASALRREHQTSRARPAARTARPAEYASGVNGARSRSESPADTRWRRRHTQSDERARAMRGRPQGGHEVERRPKGAASSERVGRAHAAPPRGAARTAVPTERRRPGTACEQCVADRRKATSERRAAVP
jgi:hypothetical protein